MRNTALAPPEAAYADGIAAEITKGDFSSSVVDAGSDRLAE
jgi:hypothetical protein